MDLEEIGGDSEVNDVKKQRNNRLQQLSKIAEMNEKKNVTISHNKKIG